MPNFPFDDLMNGQPMSQIILATQPAEGFAAMALTTGQTLNPNIAPVIRVNPAGGVTGIILTPGQRSGQVCCVVNLSGQTIAFAAAATSFVDNGGGTIPAHRTAWFVWDAQAQLWSQNNSA